ncbi:MAG TPA: rhomboid family intramembrane serine protease [Candidatus Solibacter sp.]|nr:rhomboid family intramembrane serine protease [Candidatus Solibacter sp.]
MLIPIGHENMTARRWPVITLSLIAINVVVFLLTFSTIEEQAQGPQPGDVKSHILMLAAMHPELTVPPDIQQMIEEAKARQPKLWERYQNQSVDIADPWHAKVTLMHDADVLQGEMDSLVSEYAQLNVESSQTFLQKYAFVPAHPTPASYLTANFLHGGWLHIIFNMWFLWLAGLVLEDAWGRVLYTIVYLMAGAAALQIHAWANPGSTIPSLGASGAVAALMGAFLVRFPSTQIEMLLFFRFRPYRFQAQAYWLLPLWLLNEFVGTLWGSLSGVAHWAHIGGFIFGALAALALKFSGLEHKANKAIQAKIEGDALTADLPVVQASELLEKGEVEEAITVLKNFLAAKPDSLDGWTLLQQTYWRKSDLPAYSEATTKVCAMHLKAREPALAWQDYEDLLNVGGGKMPAATWLDLCRAAENMQNLDRALSEYQKLAAAYPSEKQSLLAQIGAAKICLKQNRPQEALNFYEAAKNSAIPHLDWEQTIEAGIRTAKASLAPGQGPSSPKLVPALENTRAKGQGA